MGWTLDRECFRLLVGLYGLSIVSSLGAMVYETLGPGWSSFSDGYDLLVEQHFGKVGDASLIFGGVVLLVSLVWQLASLIGLRRFKPWARWSFWASTLLAILVSLLPGLSMPSYSGTLGSLTAEIGTGLFAVILLLAYSRDHGGLWFKGPIETLREIF